MPPFAPAALSLFPTRSTNTDTRTYLLLFSFPNAVAAKAQGTWDKFRKERDFHRMHHKRVVQEKGKLIVDMKRLRKHYAAYEPTMKQLREKYELAMKEKMLMRLERDRMASKVEALQAHVESLEQASQKSQGASQSTLGDGSKQDINEGKKESSPGKRKVPRAVEGSAKVWTPHFRRMPMSTIRTGTKSLTLSLPVRILPP